MSCQSLVSHLERPSGGDGLTGALAWITERLAALFLGIVQILGKEKVAQER
jgi:hypothetical protein